MEQIIDRARALATEIAELPIEQRVQILNAVRAELHAVSPFAAEPVDFVQWVQSGSVEANDYNPNRVAPPEMRLLERSIDADGYTQPIVANLEGDDWVVVDGFHRSRIGKESEAVRERVQGYLPVVQVRGSQIDIEERMAATIRHNRARGKHSIDGMTAIVLEYAKRNWTDVKIAKELGMDADEVLRFRQVGGLAEMFADEDFSEAWEVQDC